MAPCDLRYYDLFIEEEMVLIVSTKRDRSKDIQDPTVPYDWTLKRAAHESFMPRVDNAV